MTLKEIIEKILKWKDANYDANQIRLCDWEEFDSYISDLEKIQQEQEDLIRVLKDVKDDFGVTDGYIECRLNKSWEKINEKITNQGFDLYINFFYRSNNCMVIILKRKKEDKQSNTKKRC